MIVKKEEIIKRVSDILGDRNDDDAISFVEDLSDTLEDYETRTGEDWKAKYEENDKAWRDKYKARFFEGLPEEHETDKAEQLKEQTEEEEKELTFENLFKVEEV